MHPNPLHIEKYLYINKTPTWKVRGLYLFGIIAWFFVLFGFMGMFFIDPFYQLFIFPILALFTIYHLLSFGINLFYKQFDLERHFKLLESFYDEPSVDIFLPICGEDISIINNTWKHIQHIKYQNKKIYVLDDSKENCGKHKKLAESFGFHYFERPNKGEMKKAGNLKYVYERTKGEFIVIFDADFAPHPDFLLETIPHMEDNSIGIVQTPQYFETTTDSYKFSSLAYAAAFREEFFYRVTQVAKNRFNAAICCGSNAVYRRCALQEIGGPRQVTASEDSRTGFALLNKGWVTRYIPIILAVGVCPDNVYSYFHQQHRWCRGRSELVLSKEFRSSNVSLVAKICNTTGLLSFILRPFELLLSFQIFWVLFIYNDLISSGNFFFLPYIFFSFFLYPYSHIAKFKKEVFFASIVQVYASSHSIISVFKGKSVGWISTNAEHKVVSSAFQQTIKFVRIYIILFFLLILLGFRSGDIHLFDYRYWSVQFWIFWNFSLSFILFRQLLKTKKIIEVKNSL